MSALRTADCYAYAEVAGEGATLALFHGTGGDERQFLPLAAELAPGARLIAPRGDVSEHGALRFFRRKAEGLYDMADLAERTGRMADFLAARKAESGGPLIGLGYSNGANILASVIFAHPGLFDAAALLHPLIPWKPEAAPIAARVLITAGQRDPICPPSLTTTLARWFEAQGAPTTLHWHPGGHEIDRSEITAISRFLEQETGRAAA
jgi:phospholipase/carboxylesterase